MSKLTLSNVGSLIDSTTAQTTINNNSAATVAAMQNTLSLDGTTPNSMGADFDMNSNKIINLGEPTNDNDGARLIDIGNAPSYAIAAAASATAAAASAVAAAGSILTGNGTLSSMTNHGVVLATGATNATSTTTLTDGQLVIGLTGSAPALHTLSGDVTMTNAGVVTVANNAVTNAKSAQMTAATIKMNATGSTANATDTTIQSLTTLTSPDTTNDYMPIYDHTAGTIKKINAGSLVPVTVSARQSVLSGVVTTGGAPNFFGAGSGLTCNLSATASPLVLSYANGFSTSGSVDYIGTLNADQTAYWSGLPGFNYSYLSVDRNASTGALTSTSTIVPPQYGPVFDNTRGSLLQFANNVTDDYGNAWTNSSGTFDNTNKTVSAWSWKGDGTSASVSSPAITNFGQGPWTVEFDVNFAALANTKPLFAGTVNSDGGGFGVLLRISGTSPYHLSWFLSSDGATWDIANGTAGTTSLTTGTNYHIAISYDGINYRLFINGNSELATSTAPPIVSPIATFVLARAGSVYTNAYFGQFRFSSCARYITAFTPTLSAFTADGDFFDTNAMVMKTITGAGPTFSSLQRIYVGSAQAGASSISAVYPKHPVTQFQGGSFTQDSNVMRVGKKVYYKTGPQFITSSGSTTRAQYIFTKAQVPPDATEFYVQCSFFHVPIDSGGNSDTAFLIQLPGTDVNYVEFAQMSSAGFGTGGSQIIEPGGLGTIAIPVINGAAAFTGVITGNTGSTANITAVLVGYSLP